MARRAREVHASAARLGEDLATLARRYREVQRPTRADALPEGSAWTFELMLDGDRVIALRRGSEVQFASASGQDCTNAFRATADAVAKLNARTCVLDGVICAIAEDGSSSSGRVRKRTSRTRLVYFVFDCLMRNGVDLRPRAIEERRSALEAIVGPHERNGPIVISTGADSDPKKILQLACEAGLEGIIAKAKGSPYEPGRSATWLEIHCTLPRELSEPVKPQRTNAGRAAKRIDVGGISLSHPERVLNPANVTKLELARYYESIGAKMIPHVRGRPLSLLRWAEGKDLEKGGVFLRHARAWGPSALRRVAIREKKKIGEYLIADTPAALIALAQMDILEIHTWNSIVDNLEKPDRVVFDLDPGADVSWKRVVAAARELRALLADKGLESWVKTTGGKGLHLVVPLVPSADWDTCFAFTRSIAEELAALAPRRYVTTMAKSARAGRIFVDYLRNNRTATSVAAYSIRARPGAPVSLPIAWDELDAVKPAALTMAVVSARAHEPDPWISFWRRRQRVPKRR